MSFCTITQVGVCDCEEELKTSEFKCPRLGQLERIAHAHSNEHTQVHAPRNRQTAQMHGKNNGCKRPHSSNQSNIEKNFVIVSLHKLPWWVNFRRRCRHLHHRLPRYSRRPHRQGRSWWQWTSGRTWMTGAHHWDHFRLPRLGSLELKLAQLEHWLDYYCLLSRRPLVARSNGTMKMECVFVYEKVNAILSFLGPSMDP